MSARLARAVGPRVEASNRCVELDETRAGRLQKSGDLLALKRNRVALRIVFVVGRDLTRRRDEIVEVRCERVDSLERARPIASQR
jgi:hypothetical protein